MSTCTVEATQALADFRELAELSRNDFDLAKAIGQVIDEDPVVCKVNGGITEVAGSRVVRYKMADRFMAYLVRREHGISSVTMFNSPSPMTISPVEVSH
jgi:hypothetical protein